MRVSIYSRFSHLLIAGLTAQTRLSTTLGVYGAIALLLLVYVSAQVYTTVLSQEIAELKSDRSGRTEELHRLSSRYIGLSSHAVVAEYCEKKLGMVKADGDDMRRVAIDATQSELSRPIASARRSPPIPAAYRYTLRQTAQSDL